MMVIPKKLSSKVEVSLIHGYIGPRLPLLYQIEWNHNKNHTIATKYWADSLCSLPWRERTLMLVALVSFLASHALLAYILSCDILQWI
jgi:hypothetical protein